ncbi:MAG: hypothetical protein Q8O89_02465 [Nanoarchaeota archaeon]|nr:hypothetical protein [Nanoarchaeota archaeon]
MPQLMTEEFKIPDDVKDIVRYTELRKKHPEFDVELRRKYGCDKVSITLVQMYCFLCQLEKQDLRRR